MTRRASRGARAGLVVTAAAVTVLGGCTLDPAKIPVPGASPSGPTYRVHIEFANASNLPAQAKVVANGAKVGSLRSVTVVDPSPSAPGHVDAEVEISSATRLPVGTTAQLRQNTILGDIFIELTTAPAAVGAGALIPPGGTVPLSQTKPPLQVEDLLAGLSVFVGGGALHRLQSIIDQTNAALPEQTGETARIFDTLGGDVTDLSAHQDSLDRFLAAFQTDLSAVSDNRNEVDALLSARGAVDIPADVHSLVLTLGIIGSLGVIGHTEAWLAPLLQAGDAAAKAFVPLLLGDNPLDLGAPSNLERLVAWLRDTVIPFAQHGPQVNITGVTVTDSPISADDQVERIVRALRMIGLVR
ncbi:MlaD family protein [Nocardia terpenica]|uniref:MCE family protein n=1 Tax=Nocardia terpenica TaxID=455432 RepID=A0A6G9ZCN5_9NOCA|nr:MlaD family protein [Nocardia terpenica]QIS23379.1 MCE family protein [Nocardia terpenica]